MLPIFVYGTLQRGQVRAPLWPAVPQSVEWATTRGWLYDLGPYPALVAGDDLVRGELWQITADDLPRTLEVLDRIECYGIDDVDLYVRRVIQCQRLDGQPVQAYAYYFAHPEQLSGVPRVQPGPEGWCHWQQGPAGS